MIQCSSFVFIPCASMRQMLKCGVTCPQLCSICQANESLSVCCCRLAGAPAVSTSRSMTLSKMPSLSSDQQSSMNPPVVTSPADDGKENKSTLRKRAKAEEKLKKKEAEAQKKLEKQQQQEAEKRRKEEQEKQKQHEKQVEKQRKRFKVCSACILSLPARW